MSEKPKFVLIVGVVVTAAFVAWGAASAGEDEDRHIGHVYVHGCGDGENGRGWLGVSVEEDTGPDGGARVTWILPDSPADEIGIRKGDVIITVDGERVFGPKGLGERVRAREPGEDVEIEILRDGARQAVTANLADRSGNCGFSWSEGDTGARTFRWNQEQLEQNMGQLNERLEKMQFAMPRRLRGQWQMFGQRPKLGVQLVEATPQLREHLGGSPDAGVIVGKVLTGMPAEAAGLEVGDLIESVDGDTIEGAGDLVEAIAHKSGESITIGVIRDGRPMRFDVFLPDLDSETPTGPRA